MTRTRILDAGAGPVRRPRATARRASRPSRARPASSPETIYASLGSKRGIVDGLIERVDARPRSSARSSRLAACRTGDPRAQLDDPGHVRARAFWVEERVARDGPPAGRPATPTSPASGPAPSGRSTRAVRAAAGRAGRQGPSEPASSREAAADIAWALVVATRSSRLFVREREWTVEDFEAWLREALRREILADRLTVLAAATTAAGATIPAHARPRREVPVQGGDPPPRRTPWRSRASSTTSRTC